MGGAHNAERREQLNEMTLVSGKPIQARGESTDRQTDIWAFGVVLYESLTGISPFASRTTTETLARVLERTPDETLLPRETPAAVRRLIRRCLNKDRRHRLQHIGDARIEIEEALTSGTGASDGDSLPRPTRTRRWLIPAVVSATAVLAGIGGWWLTPRDNTSADAPVVRLTIPSIGSPIRGPNGIRHLAISRDSSRIAYASATGLFVRRLGQSEPVTVAASGENPFFSPDGQWLAFFGGNAGLSKVPSSGGVPVSLASTTDRSSGGTWSSDGTIVFATSEGLYRVSQDGGTPTLLVKPDATRQERALAWPQFLPDGRSVLFTILKEGPIDTAEVASLDLRTLQRTIIKTGGAAARYSSRGDLVYASGARLYVVPFDPVKAGIAASPSPLPISSWPTPPTTAQRNSPSPTAARSSTRMQRPTCSNTHSRGGIAPALMNRCRWLRLLTAMHVSHPTAASLRWIFSAPTRTSIFGTSRADN